jgi:hypothetical protein
VIYLRQSTASQEIPLGRFLDSTDGNTEETGLTIANTDIDIWKTGATTWVDKTSGGATHVAGGLYYCVLDATDTNTIGPLRVDVHVSGALAVTTHCVVLDEAVFDVLFGTTAPSTITAADVNAQCDTAISDAALGTAVELAKVPKSDSTVSWNATALAAINAEVDGALNTAIPGSPTANSVNERIATMDGLLLGTVQAGTHVAQSGDSFALANGTSGFVAIKVDTAAVLDDTGTSGVVIPQAQADKVWGTVARVLTAGTNIALAKGTGITGLNDLAAADVRTAVGLATANLDTQIAALPTDADVNAACDTAIKTDTAAILLDTGTDGVLLATGAVDAIHDEVVEGTTTFRQSVRLLMSALIGKVSGAPTGPIVFRDIGDTKARLTATVDADGNRTAVTRDAT